MINLYRILEVENFAPMDVVKRSYRRLVMLHHPDRGGNAEIMKQINSAYDDLKRHKALYDAKLKEYLEPAPMSTFTVVMAGNWSSRINSAEYYGNSF